MAPTARSSETILQGIRTGLLLSSVYHTSSFSSIKYQSSSVRVCSPPKLSLICCLTSIDVSVSALTARSMAEAVSAGTVAVVEELVICPPANRIPLTLATAEESPVVGLTALESVSFSLGEVVTGVGATSFG